MDNFQQKESKNNTRNSTTRKENWRLTILRTSASEIVNYCVHDNANGSDVTHSQQEELLEDSDNDDKHRNISEDSSEWHCFWECYGERSR
jgi:hypothetical protein